MCDRRGLSRSMALATLLGALAWNPAPLALAVEAEATGASSQKPVYHTVEPGETIWEIAERYGCSVASVIRENEIEDPKRVWIGARLRIPIPSDAYPRAPAGGKVDGGADRKIGGYARGKVSVEDPEAPETAALLDRCEAELRTARFEQALASAGEARDRIGARNGAADNRDRVRLEIASATAYVALGQNDAALASLERALLADPGLELDPALTSPKVLAVFRAARGRATRRP